MYHECEAAEEIAIVLTKKELHVLRMAAMRTANVMAQDMTPTAQKKVDLIDLATAKLERAFHGMAQVKDG